MSVSTSTFTTSQPPGQTEPNPPPGTNRGVENPLHERIDWISFTIKDKTKNAWPDELDNSYTDGKSFNGYDTARQYSDGRVELTHTTRHEMGIHCVMGGQACSNLRHELSKILLFVWKQGGKLTRFDIALDDELGRINPRRANEEIKRNGVVCRAKQMPFYSDPRVPGETQYLGRFSSEIMLRIYDKDAEQGVYGFRTRIEIVFKGKRADKAAHIYLSGASGCQLVAGFVQFPQWPEWVDVFSHPPVKVGAEKTESRRVVWLLGTCAKSLALEVVERSGDLDIVDKFLEAFRDHLSDLKQSGDEK